MKKATLSAFLLLPFLCFGQLTMPAVFSNNMVLQRDQTVPVWGNAHSGDKITVTIKSQTVYAIADAQGKWRTTLKALKPGAPCQLLITSNKGERIKIDSVKIGDVWICSGQSNMNWPLQADKNGISEMTGLNNDDIRMFRTAMAPHINNPENAGHSKWLSAKGDSAHFFSAVAYYFAKQMQAKTHVPIGIVLASCGNTRCESWIDTNVLRAQPALASLMAYWDVHIHDKEVNKNFVPGLFYSGSVTTIIPFSAKGMIWYQGESNTLPNKTTLRSTTERADEYKCLLQTLITSWRNVWQKPNMPFYIIQLPNYVDPSGDIQWAKLRQAQLETMKEMPNVTMITNIDLGGGKNIHPRDKQPIADRLAKWVLANEYHVRPNVVTGPIIENIKINADTAVLSFNYTGKGLMANDGDILKGFEIADTATPDNFVVAKAKVKGQKVIVWANGVSNPMCVRYGWSDNPELSLFNKNGLPATPFLIKK